MSKGLEALKEFEPLCKENGFTTFDGVFHPTGECKKYDQAYKTIEKELRALEIIRNKDIDTCLVKVVKSLEQHNDIRHTYRQSFLTQEEYDLLKEVLL